MKFRSETHSSKNKMATKLNGFWAYSSRIGFSLRRSTWRLHTIRSEPFWNNIIIFFDLVTFTPFNVGMTVSSWPFTVYCFWCDTLYRERCCFFLTGLLAYGKHSKFARFQRWTTLMKSAQKWNDNYENWIDEREKNTHNNNTPVMPSTNVNVCGKMDEMRTFVPFVFLFFFYWIISIHFPHTQVVFLF